MKLIIILGVIACALTIPVVAEAHSTPWGVTRSAAESDLLADDIEWDDGAVTVVEEADCVGEYSRSFYQHGRRFYRHLRCVVSGYDSDTCAGVVTTIRYHVVGRNDYALTTINYREFDYDACS